jgi:hypothetical protein
MKNTQPKIHTVFQIMQGLKFLHGEKHFVLAVTAKQARAAARTQLRKSYTGGTYILIDESVGQCELVTL